MWSDHMDAIQEGLSLGPGYSGNPRGDFAGPASVGTT